MKPLVALFGFMLSTLALFLQPTPNPEQSTDTIINIYETSSLLESYYQPVEYFTEPASKEIL